MAIDTNNEKLSLLYYQLPFGPPPLPGGVEMDQADSQQMLGGYPGILWSELISGNASRKMGRYIIPLIE